MSDVVNRDAHPPSGAHGLGPSALHRPRGSSECSDPSAPSPQGQSRQPRAPPWTGRMRGEPTTAGSPRLALRACRRHAAVGGSQPTPRGGRAGVSRVRPRGVGAARLRALPEDVAACAASSPPQLGRRSRRASADRGRGISRPGGGPTESSRRLLPGGRRVAKVSTSAKARHAADAPRHDGAAIRDGDALMRDRLAAAARGCRDAWPHDSQSMGRLVLVLASLTRLGATCSPYSPCTFISKVKDTSLGNLARMWSEMP
jgi:hypothetical protein